MMLKIWKKSFFGVSSCIIGGAMLGCIYSFLPLFAKDNNYSVANLMFVAIISGVVFQWPLGWLSDFFDRRKVMVGTTIAIMIPAVIVYFFTSSDSVVFIATFFVSGLCFTVYPMGITQACDRLDSLHLTTATSVLMFAYGFGAVIGPLVAPIFIQVFPPAGLFLYLAFTSLVLTVIGVYAMLRVKPVPLENQQQYVPVPSGYPAPFEEESD